MNVTVLAVLIITLVLPLYAGHTLNKREIFRSRGKNWGKRACNLLPLIALAQILASIALTVSMLK